MLLVVAVVLVLVVVLLLPITIASYASKITFTVKFEVYYAYKALICRLCVPMSLLFWEITFNVCPSTVALKVGLLVTKYKAPIILGRRTRASCPIRATSF